MELQVRNSNIYLDLEYLIKDETFSVKKLELLKSFTLKCLLNSISLILGLSSIFRGPLSAHPSFGPSFAQAESQLKLPRVLLFTID